MNKKIHFIKFETKILNIVLYHILKICKYIACKIGFVLKQYYIFIISISLFVFFYNSMSNMFSNKYILNYFLPNKLYTSKCLNLSDKQSLPMELAVFFNKNNSSNTILPIMFNTFPKYMNLLQQDSKKKVFAHIVLPILIKIEQDILEDRRYILKINSQVLEKPLENSEFNNIKSLAEKYNVKMEDYNFWDYVVAIEELVKRINIIPSSVLISSLAYDTDWGSDSYFIINSKYDFILQYFYSNHSNKIKQNVMFDRYFLNLEDALTYYYKNVNRSAEYNNFRLIRHLSNMQDINHIIRLANSLLEADYKKNINLLSIIRDNKLLIYDNMVYGNQINNTCIKIG